MAECSNSIQEVDTVRCGICLSAFTKPILLSCFHIFCTPCVAKLTEGKETLICPLCRAVHVLPDNGVGGLTLYPYVQETGPPRTNSVVFCQMCDNDKNAVSNCVDCNSKMCLDCSAYHLKHKTFKTHKTEKIEIECTENKSSETKMLEDDTCKMHTKELSHFCESCDRAICIECISHNHRLHKIEPITFPAQKRRDFLQSAISAIKSKIIAIKQEKEISKYAENNFYKLCRQGKEEIRSHAKISKDTVCKIIDVLADINLEKIDEMQKKDIKSINNHQDELETRTLSLQCLLRSTESIVNLSSNGKLFNDYAFLYQTMRGAVTQNDKFVVFAPQFCSGHPIEHKYVENCFGMVNRGKQPSTASESETHIYSLPFICDVTKFTKTNGFSISYLVRVFGICENKVWIHVGPDKQTCVKLYVTGDSNVRSQVGITDVHHILRATEKELWVKFGSLISLKKIQEGVCISTEEIIRLPELEKVTCSLLDDNGFRIIAYSVNNTCFYEVKIDGDWPITINDTTLRIIPAEEKLAKLITTEPFRIIETLSKLIILTCRNKVITLDRHFRMCNVHENNDSDFKGMCRDPYGNIFIVDFNMNTISLFNSNGEIMHNVSIKDIYRPIDITRDSVGHIWVADNNGGRVMVYSYF